LAGAFIRARISLQSHPEPSPHGARRAPERRKRDRRIIRIEQPVELTTARVHARGHGGLAQALLAHRDLDLIGDDLLDRGVLGLGQQAVLVEELVECLAAIDVALLLRGLSSIPLTLEGLDKAMRELVR
jgi:hypothetical protein